MAHAPHNLNDLLKKQSKLISLIESDKFIDVSFLFHEKCYEGGPYDKLVSKNSGIYIPDLSFNHISSILEGKMGYLSHVREPKFRRTKKLSKKTGNNNISHHLVTPGKIKNFKKKLSKKRLVYSNTPEYKSIFNMVDDFCNCNLGLLNRNKDRVHPISEVNKDFISSILYHCFFVDDTVSYFSRDVHPSNFFKLFFKANLLDSNYDTNSNILSRINVYGNHSDRNNYKLINTFCTDDVEGSTRLYDDVVLSCKKYPILFDNDTLAYQKAS